MQSNGLSQQSAHAVDHEYDPFNSDNYYTALEHGSQTAGASVKEPDDFYRSFADREKRPDIVVETDDASMAPRTKTRRSSGPGLTAKNFLSSLKPPSQKTATRSASGPAGSRPTLSTAKSVPSLAGTLKNGLSVKERAKQLDKSRENARSQAAGSHRNGILDSRPPSVLSTTSDVHDLSARSPRRRRRLSKTEKPSSRSRSRASTRRPLFGEIVGASMRRDGAGYGIPSIAVEDAGDVNSLQMAAHSRSRSDAGSPPVGSPNSHHARSKSYECDSQSSSAGLRSPSVSPILSRIPRRTRRTSDVGQSHNTPRYPSHQATTRDGSTSPVLLSNRRYSPPRKYMDASNTITAVVKTPPAKASPPLRSTRNRQQLTAATASSRAKVTERFVSLSTTSKQTVSKPKPTIPGQVDVAERRARLQKSFQSGPGAKPVRTDLNSTRSKKSSSPRSKRDASESSAVVSDSRDQSQRYPSDRPAPIPAISIPDSAPRQESEPPKTRPDNNFEESPILGRGEGRTLPGSFVEEPPLSDPAEAPPVQQIPQNAADGLLKHVMNLRDAASLHSPATQVPDDYLTQVDEAGTIQIMLGVTPQLQARSWSPETEHAPSSPEAFHTPQEEEEVYGDLDSRAHFDGFDGWSSIVPDDSVSVVGSRRYAELLGRERPPPIPFTSNKKDAALPNQTHTLTTEARSEINRVLDIYQQGDVTHDQARGLQQHIEALTPNLSRHEAWESTEATQSYLRNALDEMEMEKVGVDVDEDDTADSAAYRVSSQKEGSSGVAIVFNPPKLEETAGAPIERKGTLHSHSTSDATLRPTKQDVEDENHETGLDDLAFRQDDPSKDYMPHADQDASRLRSIPSLPAISGAVSGLGLSMESVASDKSPQSPHPPAPRHAPPEPPTPLRNDFDQTQSAHTITPTAERRRPFEGLALGLPSSPAATRGRRQDLPPDQTREQSESTDPSRSRGVSLETPLDESRSQSPISTSRSTAGDRSSQNFSVHGVEKELNGRRHVIKELIDTENVFHQDLTIMTDIYLGTASDVLQEQDRRILFGNLEQLRAFTTEFLDALKRAAAPVYTIPRENRWNAKRGSFSTSNSETRTDSSSANSVATVEERVENDRRTTVGATFVEHLPMLQKVYSEWLRGAIGANKRLAELMKEPTVKYWLDECIENHKDLTTAWNLDSLIVKPFQRSTKYSLLLDDLLKNTPPDHPDYNSLKQAKGLVREYNERANNAQKRSEVVAEAMGKGKSKPKFGKVLTNRTERIKQQVGLVSSAEDPDYDAISQKFGGHFFQLQVVMRDVEKYLDDTKIYVDQYCDFMDSLCNNISMDSQYRFPADESKWIQFSKAVAEMRSYALEDHVAQVRKSVIDPIQQLWRLHVGPQRAMAKRKKRLIDYVRHKTMVEKGEKVDKSLKENAEKFAGLNDALKEELPQLYALTKKLVDNCLLNFIDLSVQWQSVWMRKLGPLIDDLDELQGLDLDQSLFRIINAYHQEFADPEDLIATFRLCNKSLVTEARNIKSPATTYSREDEASFKRPSTLSSNGKRAVSLGSETMPGHTTPNPRISGGDNLALSPLVGAMGMPDGIFQHHTVNRNRAGSSHTNHDPSPSYPMTGPSTFFRSDTGESGFSSPGDMSVNLDLATSQSTPNLVFVDVHRNNARSDSSMPVSPTAEERYSGIFHSALPMSESAQAEEPPAEGSELQVLFLAASLFEFHIDSTRREGGYPYLTYQPGEIFDVIAQKGELWLAKNQDDAGNTIGWIWEKHFARILPDS